MSHKTHATIEDLYKAEGKAELVNGEIVEIPRLGDDPSIAGGQIFVSLHQYARETRSGRAYPGCGPDSACNLAPPGSIRALTRHITLAHRTGMRVSRRRPNLCGGSAERD